MFARRLLERLQDVDDDGIVFYPELWSKLAASDPACHKPNYGQLGGQAEQKRPAVLPLSKKRLL